VKTAAAAIVLGLLVCGSVSARQATILQIKVTVVDADQHERAIPRHALLISDNPATAAPRRVLTGLDGTAQVPLRPGNYTVESDEPLIFQGKSYVWTQTLDVPGGRVTTLNLTAANAEVAAATGADTQSAAAVEASASTVIVAWQNSVVSIWTPTRQGAGFLVDARGLIATSQRVVGVANTVEVQVSRNEKYLARVVAGDAQKNIAILWLDPKPLGAAPPVKLASSDAARAPIAERDKVFAMEPSVQGTKRLTSGTVKSVTAESILTDIGLDRDSSGAPLFNGAGDVVGVMSIDDARPGSDELSLRAVPIAGAATVIASAEKWLQRHTEAPSTRLPVEPERPFPEEALRDAVRSRGGSLSAYSVPAADFDVSVITPLLLYGAEHGPSRAIERERAGAPRNPAQMQPGLAALEDFGNWSDYVSDYPPVVLIRATPKLAEGFWTTVARGAAQTQGMAIPPIKRPKGNFASLRLDCDGKEVTPIHPFRIERHLGETAVLYEGLYVFAYDALEKCTAVKLTLVSEKDPDKADIRVVDPRIVEQIQKDFAGYR